MKRSKKILLAALILCLLLSGMWFYWEWQMPLTDLLPEENWISLELWQGDGANTGVNIAYDAPPLEEILTQFSATRVSRAEKDLYIYMSNMSQSLSARIPAE